MRYSDAELVEELTAIADELGHPPTLDEFREYGDHSVTTYYERFGSWNDALKAAGFEPRDSNPKIPKDDLLSELTQLADALGESPSAQQMNDQGEYWASTYQNRFDSWNAALEAAGLEPAPPDTEISESALLTELRRLADELGDSPTFTQMSEQGAFSPTTYLRHFGSWNAALEAADLEPTMMGANISDSELLAEIRQLAEALDKRPSARDMKAEGEYAVATYQRHFGSWSAAVEEALDDLPPR